MRVLNFKQSHLKHMRAWLMKRGMNTTLADDLPRIGSIALDGNQPVCAGFLREMEGKYCMFDALISDPEAKPEKRNEALDLLTTRLVQRARNKKFKKIIATVLDKNTLMRSARFGFLETKETLIVLDLRG